MLKLISSLNALPFGEVVDIYSEYQGNPWSMNQVQDFYAYLKEDFFPNNGVYALWEEEGMYKSAVRLVPWENGILLTGLETKRQDRNRGYAKALLYAVAEYVEKDRGGILYAHVSKDNTASIATHRTCGFVVLSENAKLLDGSVLSDHYTLRLSH